MTKADALLKTALHLIADNGWTEFTLADLARNKGIKLAQVHAVFPSRLCVIEAFAKSIDQSTLEHLEEFEEDETPRDRIFSVIMTRFDILTPHKAVISALWEDGWKDPFLMMSCLPLGLNSMSWMLQAAGIDTTGLLGALRIKSFAAFYMNSVWTWLKDESEGLDETMAALDKGLLRLGQFPGFYS